MTFPSLSGRTSRPSCFFFPLAAPFRFVVAVLASVLLWAGCATPRVKEMQGPTRITGPAVPALEIQSRLLQDARLSLAEGRDETATLLLRRLITTYPQSSLLPEARWWLARSYEQAGDVTEALVQYRLLAQTAPEGSLGGQARARIAELERDLVVTSAGASGHVAMLVPSHHLPPQQNLDEWVRQLAQAGVTALVVEASAAQGQEQGNGETGGPDGHPRHRPGVYFRTHWAPTIRDVVGQLVPVAHRYRVQVFSAVALRRMNWLASGLQWSDQAYDPATRRLVVSSALDLFHPVFQEYLVGLLTDLAAGGVDGILFRADGPLGPTEGFSPYGLKGFERDFGVKPEPARFFAPEGLGGSGGNQQDYAPEFWRWAGWKARETLKVMDRLRRALRKQSPRLQVALEVHPEAVTDPVRALVRLNEDLLEAKRLRFDYYVVGGPLASGQGRGAPMPGGVERAVELIGEAGRIWVAAPIPGGDIIHGETSIKPALDRTPFVKGIGIMYMPLASPMAGAIP